MLLCVHMMASQLHNDVAINLFYYALLCYFIMGSME